MNEADEAFLAIRIAHLTKHAQHDQGAAMISVLHFEDFATKLLRHIGVAAGGRDQLAHVLALISPRATYPIDKPRNVLGTGRFGLARSGGAAGYGAGRVDRGGGGDPGVVPWASRGSALMPIRDATMTPQSTECRTQCNSLSPCNFSQILALPHRKRKRPERMIMPRFEILPCARSGPRESRLGFMSRDSNFYTTGLRMRWLL
jgi:hypothetical protein